MSRKIVAIITSITGDRVVIGEAEFLHALTEHFQYIPSDILLELIEKILKDPTKIFEEKKSHVYHLFYRLDHRGYLVVVVKKSESGCYFSTIYPTGKNFRKRHKNLKEVRL